MVTAALTTAAGLLGGQSRRDTTQTMLPSVIPSLAMAKDKKTMKALMQEADKERMYAIFTNPQLMGIIIALAGIVVANRIPYTGDKEADILIASVATMMVVVIACGYAGVGDLTGAVLALATGGANLIGKVLDEFSIWDLLKPW